MPSAVVSVLLLNVAFDRALDYAVPTAYQERIQRGMQVVVPLRGKPTVGYVLELKEKSPFTSSKLLPVHSLLSESALLDPTLFDLALWMSRYYNASLRQVLKQLIPASVREPVAAKEQACVKRLLSKEKLRQLVCTLRESHPSQARVVEVLLMEKQQLLLTELLEKAGVSQSPVETLQKKGVLSMERLRIYRSPLIGEEYFKTPPKPLNAAQQEAYDTMCAAIAARRFETHLLYGVTGSGKTEVYLQLIEYTLKQGLCALMLVPEIALTGQTIQRLRARFDEKIAILHHQLSQGERSDEWHRVHRGEAKIVVGARSALFSPLQLLGLIIVDEEHEGAYKQNEEPPCYQARDLAVMRGKLTKSLVVLGSATPSLESYYNAQQGKYKMTILPTRATAATLPKIHIVDMKREYEKAGGWSCFSELLIEKMKKRLANGEQTILFLNRRGYSTSLSCKSCGHIFCCPCCDLALTFHRGENTLCCHLCDWQTSPPPLSCPQCHKGEMLKYRGIGTEQLEKAVHALFPEARTLRIDGDTTRHKGSHERLFRAFSTQKADILIGTQMVAKGLHFPAVTLVAIIHGDSGLHLPDFRASERVFQMITQVAGRAGRADLAGEVIIQTTVPQNTTIHQAAHYDFEGFYQTELQTRQLFQFPPYAHLVKLTFSGPEALLVQKSGEEFRKELLQRLEEKNLTREYKIYPLVPPGYAKIKNQFRFQCLIRGKQILLLNELISLQLAKKPLPRAVRLHLDVDPSSIF